MIAAIELVQVFETRQPFPATERIGAKVCQAARRHGLLTRPIGDVLLLMPPYCITEEQLLPPSKLLRYALQAVLCWPLTCSHVSSAVCFHSPHIFSKPRVASSPISGWHSPDAITASVCV